MYLIWFNLLSECEGVDMCCSVCICFVACGSTRQLDWRFDFLVCERGQGGLENKDFKFKTQWGWWETGYIDVEG